MITNFVYTIISLRAFTENSDWQNPSWGVVGHRKGVSNRREKCGAGSFESRPAFE
ncbi:hypothetical protein [Caldanaerovirga acetigignens]|uniref:hypothetical protein n=1 Tax=Caldanaerovirga acetigignens TaxID=447595 RepID=UPI001FCA4D47|nr:hypothetical protein [Caldanaerovirga acetigignens]